MGEIKHNKRLSICAISWNEERDLPHWLANVVPLADEVIIVDDGSNDKTEEIARQAGVKVKFFSYPMGPDKHFGNQRNRCISHATGEWLLHMDIDERITPEFYQELEQAIQQTGKVAFRYERLNYFIQRPMRHGGWGGWNRPQLARRQHHQFKNAIHEVCEIEGTEEQIGQLRSPMLHLTDDKVADRFRKSVTYSSLVAEKYVRAGKKVRWYHLLLLPPAKFIQRYILKGGFRDGAAGFIFCLQCASAVYQRHAIAWNIQNEVAREQLEQTLKKAWQKDQ